jgi:hypothetical protein
MTKSLNPEEDAGKLAEQLFGEDAGRRAWFTGRLLDIYGRVRDRDFLLIHNPGGWGTTPIDELLQWERSIVEGVSTTIEKLGYSCQLVQ